MRKIMWSIFCVSILLGMTCQVAPERGVDGTDICAEYITAWQDFNPSRAFSRGFFFSIFKYEDFRPDRVSAWIEFNRNTLEELKVRLSRELSLDDRINARLLQTQVRRELVKWETEEPHKNSLAFYAGPISQAVSRLWRSDLLTQAEKIEVIKGRLGAVQDLCAAAVQMLENGSPESAQRSLEGLERAQVYYADRLPKQIAPLLPQEEQGSFNLACQKTAQSVKDLIVFAKEHLLPDFTLSDSTILGKERYAQQLALYTDSDLTPGKLEEIAFQEIQEVRELMAQASREYLLQAHPGQDPPTDFEVLVKKALGAMEENRPLRELEYLAVLRKYAQEAEDFVREKEIATIPAHQTLSIELAPESAGPMARIGYVRPAAPFHPNPWTTWYLANIPDSFPDLEREDFWRSFNYHFKKFIVIHELFPGHYIQSKILRENPHPIRILFPYGLYSEGWATLCERVALDAGWDDGNKLTILAQLRKRLENANRAYTSVQVHCNGWNPAQVLEFSVNTSLLAPQFAKSLWGRLMSSPMQITSYFLGNLKFDAIYEAERKRLGEDFETKDFMDTILRAGPIPLDMFPQVLEASLR